MCWRFASQQSASAKLDRGGLRWSRAQEKAARRRWATEFQTKTAEEQREWERLYSLPSFEDEPIGGQQPPREQDLLDMLEQGTSGDTMDPIASSRQPWPVDLGDDTWPLTAETFAKHLKMKATQHGMPEWRGGFVRVGNACRAELRAQMCVDADPILTPVLRVPVCCREAHPGLCAQRDEAILADALTLARAIHKELHALGTGTFVGFHTIAHSVMYSVGAVRLRDPELAVLAETTFHRDAAGPSELVCLLVSEDGEFSFATGYAIARDLVVSSAGRHKVEMSVMEVKNSPDTPLTAQVVSRTYRTLRDELRGDEGGDGHGQHREGVEEQPDMLDVIEQAEHEQRPPARQQRSEPGIVAKRPRPHPESRGHGEVAVCDSGEDSGSELEDQNYCVERMEDNEAGLPQAAQPAGRPEAAQPAGAQAQGQVVAPRGEDAEPAEQPPDVPVPPAAAVQLRERRSGDDGWPRLQMPSGDGYIRLSMNAQFVWDMRACCEGCNATLSRTCKPSQGARPGSRASGQGRPLGKLWAWLLWAAQNPGHSAEDHRAYVPDLAARQSARRDVSRPEIQAQQWMDSECPGHVLGIDLEDGEPLHVP